MSGERHPEESLAALIDGELSGEHRERVLAHLVHCASCKGEAEEQRRLKDTFARIELPAPPAGLMARLHGLPAGPLPGADDDGGPRRPVMDRWPRREPFPSGRRGRSVTPVPIPVSLPGPGHESGLPGPGSDGGLPGGSGPGGLPVHRPGSARSASALAGTASEPLRERGTATVTLSVPRGGQRSHRLAFAAAGAFSLAAFAIGGAVTSTHAGPVPSANGPAALASSGGSGTPAGVPTRGAARDAATASERALRFGSAPGFGLVGPAHGLGEPAPLGVPPLVGGEPSRLASGPAPYHDVPFGPRTPGSTPGVATPTAPPTATPSAAGTLTPR